MGIRSINIAMGASYGAYSQRLTQATMAKLEVLGISYNQNTTEDEGRRLIRAHEAQQNQNANQQGFSQNNSNQSDLFEKAKKLAQKVGVTVPENIDFKQLLSLIEAKLEEKISASSNNMSALKELKSLSQDLAFIQAQSNGSSGYENTNQALMASLEMLSEYNKNFLNK